jgi:hypothetical protein
MHFAATREKELTRQNHPGHVRQRWFALCGFSRGPGGMKIFEGQTYQKAAPIWLPWQDQLCRRQRDGIWTYALAGLEMDLFESKTRAAVSMCRD